jgi:hypothetical protein
LDEFGAVSESDATVHGSVSNAENLKLERLMQ